MFQLPYRGTCMCTIRVHVYDYGTRVASQLGAWGGLPTILQYCNTTPCARVNTSCGTRVRRVHCVRAMYRGT